jgi:ferric-dicitrate binding protein FerR (iron transport regulator)
MMHSSNADEDLFHALAARARATSDGYLVLAVILGLAATLGIAVWRPPAWLLLGSIAVGAAAFGAWGIADRELVEHSTMPRLSVRILRIGRVVSLMVGTCAAIVAAFAMLGVALGTWIS